MADTTNTTPGSPPGVPTTGSDGAVPDLGGRRVWVWSEHQETGARTDIRSDRLEAGRRRGYLPVPGYPVNLDRMPRRPLPRTDKAGNGQPPAGELADQAAADTVDQAPAQPVDEAADTAGGDTTTDEAVAADADQATTTRKGGRQK